MEQAATRSVPLRDERGRFVTSGNPHGMRIGRSARFKAKYAELLADYRDLTAVDRALLERAVHALVRADRCKDDVTMLRLSGTAKRLLGMLQSKRVKPQPPPSGMPPLAELLRREREHV